MQEILNVALLQADLVWENKIENLKAFDIKLKALSGRKIDLVVLPEMFTTGFSMDAVRLADKASYNPTLAWMKTKAFEYEAALCGSFMVEENGQYFNRLHWVQPDGVVLTYDKRHLFTLAGEHEHYTAGSEKLIVEWKGWKICPLICYDLRFPVWSRNVEAYDLLIYIANWPNRRIHAWKTLLAARAIENQSYCIGVNIVGTDANGNQYNGESSAINCEGYVLYEKKDDIDVKLLSLDAASQANFRKKFPFLKDQDSFLTKL
jgi:predicted amidohydrolase